MDIMIELSEAEVEQVSGGVGSASFSITNSATGVISASVSGTLTQTTTTTTAAQSGTFTSTSV